METIKLKVKDLALYRGNYRTVPQPDEPSAIHALVYNDPDWFWGLARSLIKGGYLPTENILVLKGPKKEGFLIVREGNRRIAAMKIIHGFAARNTLSVPNDVEEGIVNLPADWKKKNSMVPCAVCEPEEAETAENIVDLTHGKGEHASRLDWTSVGTARHNRNRNGTPEPALDLLEKYLQNGRNLTTSDQERWAGHYHLSLLRDIISRLSSAHGLSIADFIQAYPAIKYRSAVEQILNEIGHETLTFTNTRNTDFIAAYGIVPAPSGITNSTAGNPQSGTSIAPGAGTSTQSAKPKTQNPIAYPLDDPRSVYKALRQFIPKGGDRSKVASFLKEMRQLRLNRHPMSFCFLLRGIFEISAKAYCKDVGLKVVDKNGYDRKLLDVLKDVANHLTDQMNPKNPLTKTLHGAVAELSRKSSFLSVTSMNLLVHNPTFSVDERHISTEFNNVFPLVQEMNR